MKKILVAFSGGPDSVYLSYLHRDNYDLILFHLNHKMDEGSDNRSIRAKEIADFLNILCVVEALDVPPKNEKEARFARYKMLFQYAKENDISEIWTGHHQDDQVETMMMRIARGSTLLGLSGIRENYLFDKILVRRPLLSHTISKPEIMKFLDKNSIPYIKDPTNQDCDITRNLYRNKLIPSIVSKNDKKRLVNISKIISAKLPQVLIPIMGYQEGLGFDYDTFVKLSPDMRSLGLSFLWKQYKDSPITTKKVLQEFENQSKRNLNIRVSMPDNCQLVRKKDRLIIVECI